LFITASDKLHGEKSTKFHVPSFGTWYNYFKVHWKLQAQTHTHKYIYIYIYTVDMLVLLTVYRQSTELT